MERMIGAEIPHDRSVQALQECGAYRRILEVDFALISGQGAACAAAVQTAAALARVVALARQLLPRCLSLTLAAEAGDERERLAAGGDGRINDTRQQPIERKNECYNVADDSVTKLETRLHNPIKRFAALPALIGINPAPFSSALRNSS